MTMAYIRKTYGVPVSQGQSVRLRKWPELPAMTVTSATHYVRARDPDGMVRQYHPLDLEYKVGWDWVTSEWEGER